jgi:hypothetical protein
MPNRFRTNRWMILLGAVLSLAFLGFTQTRPVLKAQEPAKVSDKKAQREQIIALHAEIDLLEVELRVDREALFDAIKEERPLVSKLEQYFRENFGDKFESPDRPYLNIFDNDFEICGMDVWLYFADSGVLDGNKLKEVLSILPKDDKKKFDNRIIEVFGKEYIDEYESLIRIENPVEFAQARKRLADRMKPISLKRGIDGIRQKSDQVRKELYNRSAEITGKKLDLVTLERQYHEAR